MILTGCDDAQFEVPTPYVVCSFTMQLTHPGHPTLIDQSQKRLSGSLAIQKPVTTKETDLGSSLANQKREPFL